MKRDALRTIARQLDEAGIPFVVGGSGLLFLLGLQGDVGDWDILTDAPLAAVEDCLRGRPYRRLGPKPPFVSRYLLQMEIEGTKVEVIGGFALLHEGRRVEVPAVRGTVVTASRSPTRDPGSASTKCWGRTGRRRPCPGPS